ncbi:uncharacterized protein [Elaeis guineensis]|uniref:Uncharacterized protein LOC105033004 n=1 Tax=Elaeis guineensis var. tenera TaxID=51953 RepID=A0A6J0PHC3_ELAGV|nr:uncharacterized protein LOC105033004 [Elaeis guineensis]XP_019705538.1 uncharacterized protein LOC105033004 [Elaeis guineensis]
MAKNMEDVELWLPSEFLCDDFFLEGDKTTEADAEVAGASFSSELYSGSDSNPSSVVESPTPTVTESEEEGYMACLTQEMAHSFLQDDEGSPLLPGDNVKTREIMAGSPQSTLSPWSASGKGNPVGPSIVPSPSLTPVEQDEDLLYDAALQVRRLRLNDPSNKHNIQDRGLLRKPPPPISTASNNHSTGYHDAHLTQQQLRAVQFHHLKQQQLMKGRQSRARGSGCVGVYGEERRYGGPLGLPSSAWPPLQKPQLQPPPDSGMRAVFLTGAGVRKESAGTGVFLPRRVGVPTESREKPACWTVLLPARVGQTLNLNLEELGSRQRYAGS